MSQLVTKRKPKPLQFHVLPVRCQESVPGDIKNFPRDGSETPLERKKHPTISERKESIKFNLKIIRNNEKETLRCWKFMYIYIHMYICTYIYIYIYILLLSIHICLKSRTSISSCFPIAPLQQDLNTAPRHFAPLRCLGEVHHQNIGHDSWRMGFVLRKIQIVDFISHFCQFFLS